MLWKMYWLKFIKYSYKIMLFLYWNFILFFMFSMKSTLEITIRDSQTHPTFLKHLPRKSIIVIHWATFFLIFMYYYQLRDTSPKFTEKQIKQLIKKYWGDFHFVGKLWNYYFLPSCWNIYDFLTIGNISRYWSLDLIDDCEFLIP